MNITKGAFEKEFKDLMEKINTTLSESSMNLFQYEGGLFQEKWTKFGNF